MTQKLTAKTKVIQEADDGDDDDEGDDNEKGENFAQNLNNQKIIIESLKQIQEVE